MRQFQRLDSLESRLAADLARQSETDFRGMLDALDLPIDALRKALVLIRERERLGQPANVMLDEFELDDDERATMMAKFKTWRAERRATS